MTCPTPSSTPCSPPRTTAVRMKRSVLQFEVRYCVLMSTLCCAGNIADAADTFVTMGEFLEQISTMKEFAHLGQMFEWRHAFRRLQPPALPGAVAEQELVPIQPDAALEAIVGFRKDSAEKLGSRLDEQLVRNQQRKHRVGGRTRTVSKAEARRKGEVTWEMFVMVLQSSDDMNERCVRHLCRLETAWLLSPLILVCADCPSPLSHYLGPQQKPRVRLHLQPQCLRQG